MAIALPDQRAAAVCRLYGPPGLAQQVAGLVRGILWDRAGLRAPRFVVAELHGDLLRRFRITAGRPEPEPLGSAPAADGLLLEEAAFRIRSVTLDHGGTPVLAFAFEPTRQINVRRERLAARGWTPGPWLGRLKHLILTGDTETLVEVPDGNALPAHELSSELLLDHPGKRLVYATDLADTPDNRKRLTALARGAHTFVCESPFLAEEWEHAARTGHLTARACGEMAAAAKVGQLMPFHFSRRHASEPQRIYAEVRAAYPQTVLTQLRE